MDEISVTESEPPPPPEADEEPVADPAVPPAEEAELAADASADAPSGEPGDEIPAQKKLGPGQNQPDEVLLQELTVLLFASPEPLGLGRLVDLLERPATARVKALLERLREQLEEGALPMRLVKVAGAWRLVSDPGMAEVVGRLRAEPRPERISAAALETLSIIAYRQPVSKAEIEAIRGVQAGPILRALVDRSLVRIAGRADLPGQPLLYGTTKEFLDRFGLASLDDLPRDGELNEE
jgi:segregation and condensation protein B